MLFTTNEAYDYAKPQHDKAAVCGHPEQHTHSLLGRVSDVVEAVFPPITPGHSYHYATAGLWSTHDLLLHILRQTGPARIWIATWSMTEDACRVLVQGIQEGIIADLRLLIDSRVITRNASAYAFVKAHAEKTRITACHAKVTVIENDEWSISMVGSANYTNNPRIEAGVVTESRPVGAFHRDWIDREMDKAKPFGETLKLLR